MIDTSFLLTPVPEKEGEKVNGEGWGFSNPSNPSIIKMWETIKTKVNATSIFEVGMFAGHSTVMMLETFPFATVTSFDPGQFSRRAAVPIQKKYPNRFIFWAVGIDRYEQRDPIDLDLMFIDGSHTYKHVKSDIQGMNRMQPKWVLFDNIELPDVRRAIKEAGLFKTEMNPEYFFYVNEHKGNTSPGIFMLVKL